MNISELKNSRFLTKEDCDPPILATIRDIERQNVAAADADPEQRWVMRFDEPEIKPLVLNVTNGEALAEITGSPESEGWVGTKVVLYHERNVTFAGKRTGGIRLREYRPVSQVDQEVPF